MEYLRYIQKYAHVMPRTYWSEHPFYQIIDGLRQYYRLGYRPEDLAHLETIEKKAWQKHEVHLQRLEQFPLDKAANYQRLKQLHGASIRGLSKITGEDYSYIGKVLRTLELPCEIKDFLEENKNDPDIVFDFLFPLALNASSVIDVKVTHFHTGHTLDFETGLYAFESEP